MSMVPQVAESLIKDGYSILVEQGAGIFSGYTDEAYAAKGCKVCSRGDVMKQSEAGRGRRIASLLLFSSLFDSFPKVFHPCSPFAQVVAELSGVSYETCQLDLRAIGFLGTQRGGAALARRVQGEAPRGKWSQGDQRQGSD